MKVFTVFKCMGMREGGGVAIYLRRWPAMMEREWRIFVTPGDGGGVITEGCNMLSQPIGSLAPRDQGAPLLAPGH